MVKEIDVLNKRIILCLHISCWNWNGSRFPELIYCYAKPHSIPEVLEILEIDLSQPDHMGTKEVKLLC